MDDLEIRTIQPGEELAHVRAVSRQFHEDEPDEELQRYVSIVEPDRAFAVRDGDDIVGTYAIQTATLSVPGGASLPCAAVTAVGVAQAYRRRGLLRRLMAAGLDQAVEREEPVAALYASESAIYGRFGFGVSAPAVRYRAERAHVRFRSPVDDRLVRPATVDEAVASWPAILEAGVRARRGGCLDRRQPFWELWLRHDPPSGRHGASARRLVHVPGRGYAAYRVKGAWRDGLPDGTVEVEELVATDPEAEQALWQHVLDVDLTATTESWGRPPDDALPWLVTDRLRLRAGEGSALYTRILDVPAALSGRGYRATGALVFEVVDDTRDQSGTYRLESDPSGSSCTRTDADPALVLPIDALSSVWLGGVRAVQLLAARRIEERLPGAAAHLDVLVATDLLPWTPFEF